MVNLDHETHPVSSNWQWMCCVHIPLPVVARLSVSKDLHLEVPHHGVHHLPAECKNTKEKATFTRPLCFCTWCFLKVSIFRSWIVSFLVPVDPSRPFLRLDVDVIVIDINLGNLHLEVIGKEPDGFPHRAEAGTPRRLEQRGRCGRACRERERGKSMLEDVR